MMERNSTQIGKTFGGNVFEKKFIDENICLLFVKIIKPFFRRFLEIFLCKKSHEKIIFETKIELKNQTDFTKLLPLISSKLSQKFIRYECSKKF